MNILVKNSPREIAMAHFPELFGVKAEMNAEDDASLNPNARVQVNLSGNSLNAAGATLWSTVAGSAVDAASKKYFDLTRFSHATVPAVQLPPGVQPVINVPVVLGAGEAKENLTDWATSALSQKYVPVAATRVSTPFGLSTYDIADGENLNKFLAAAVESTMAKVTAIWTAAVAATVPDDAATTAPTAEAVGKFVTDASTWGPEVIAKEVSKVFGDYGAPDCLVLSPDLYAAVIPTNALSLNPSVTGTYGIGTMGMSAGLAAVGKGAGKGVAVRAGGLGVVNTVPDLAGLDGVAVRDLGTVNGVHMLLKTTVDPLRETFYCSVETYFGAKVLNPQAVSVLV